MCSVLNESHCSSRLQPMWAGIVDIGVTSSWEVGGGENSGFATTTER